MLSKKENTLANIYTKLQVMVDFETPAKKSSLIEFCLLCKIIKIHYFIYKYMCKTVSTYLPT